MNTNQARIKNKIRHEYFIKIRGDSPSSIFFYLNNSCFLIREKFV